MAAPGIVETRIIPYGVDRSLFQAADKRGARVALPLSPDARVLLVIATYLKQNPATDYSTLRAAVARVAERVRGSPVIFIARG